MSTTEAQIEVENLTVGYGDTVVLHDVSFTISRGDVFVIMGGSGCGKSTLMRSMIGLVAPVSGSVLWKGIDLWTLPQDRRRGILRRMGVLYQSGALWSSMTLGENVSLPLVEFTHLSRKEIDDVVAYKLALVGLYGYQDHYPAELSGGMRKRAALARAMALDPEVLFFDEPSAGLDPLTSKRLDDLIRELSTSLGATVVMVTHELDSIFAIGTNSIFLDARRRTVVAHGPPHELLRSSQNPAVHRFLTRGETKIYQSDARSA